MSTQTQPPARLRSSLADAAWGVQERVVWGVEDAFRGVADVVKWPFERIAWALERGLIWPLQERTSGWDGPLRVVGLALLIAAAIGTGVAGLLWAAPDGSGPTAAETATVPSLPIARAPAEPVTPDAPVLHGAAPVFTPQAHGKAGDISQAQGKVDAGTAPAQSTATPSNTPDGAAAAVGQPAGPAALEVAHRFANAFVLYETGEGSAKVRDAFAKTATPQLTHSLLRRPPRLPANVKVPKAKVLNLVAGPSHGGIYSVSVSLLRVGLTSELRLEVQQVKDNWRVTNVLG